LCVGVVGVGQQHREIAVPDVAAACTCKGTYIAHSLQKSSHALTAKQVMGECIEKRAKE
jgi:hypothetical protein